MASDFYCVISPRNKFQGMNICSPLQDGSENESSISPASTLSEVNYNNINNLKNILNYQPYQPIYAKTQSAKTQPTKTPYSNQTPYSKQTAYAKSVKAPYAKSIYRNQPNRQSLSTIHHHKQIGLSEYKKKLKSLNSLLSPIQLFHDIDLMIKNYDTLKKEYCLQWELQQLYRQQIRSLLKQNNRDQNNDYITSLQDIELLIQRLQNIHFSIMEIFQNCFATKKMRNSPVKSVKSSNVITPRAHSNNFIQRAHSNIKPSHAKRLSTSSTHQLTKRKKTKQKRKPKTDRVSKYNHNSQSTKLYGMNTNDYRRGTCTTRSMKNTYGNVHTSYPSPLRLNDHILMSPNDPSQNQSQSQSQSPSETSQDQSSTTIQTKSRRRSSIRSFGSLYSDEFRYSVAESYKSRMTLHDEFKQTDDFLGLAHLQIVEYYHDNYIGQNEIFESPFGVRPVIYCDWTASGKALHCVEDYIKSEMLTLYANTHTTTSITGIQTSKFRSEARSIILESIGGEYNEDVIIFAGSGSTAAIYKIAHVLMKQNGYKPSATVVFISIYEHNSNIFIWKELGCKVIVIPERKSTNNNNNRGGLDLKVLERYLKFYTSGHMKQKYSLLIGSFSAASNVSGIMAPVDKCTLLLHRYSALAMWDYATAGPYMHVNMTNKQNPMLSKDAVFISPHKYLGGPGSPGILCAKKRLFLNYTPVVSGGGTVFIAYGVEDGQWEYLDNIEEREEGGTPDIIGSVRAAFAFMIKDHLTTEFIEHREKEYLAYFWKECKSIPNLIIMGNKEYKRLPVISFLITHTKKGFGAAKKTKYLHYNFIAALMNDLFGIQGRGGCACAGMYGKYVLNMSMSEVNYVVTQLRNNKNELSRPGYFRINLHYTLTKHELEYIINAVKFVCQKGWLFLSLYDVDVESGNYFHRHVNVKKQLRSLLDISFNTNQMKWKRKGHLNTNYSNAHLNKYFAIADNIVLNLNDYLPNIGQFKNERKICDKTAWYWLPSELFHDIRDYIQ